MNLQQLLPVSFHPAKHDNYKPRGREVLLMKVSDASELSCRRTSMAEPEWFDYVHDEAYATME
jgi:hypothetical protein